MKQCFLTTNGPKAIGPYSTAVISGKTVYLSGMIPADPATGKIVEGSWAYDVNVYANGIKVSIVSVNNLKGIVAFSYTAKG